MSAHLRISFRMMSIPAQPLTAQVNGMLQRFELCPQKRFEFQCSRKFPNHRLSVCVC